MKWNIIKEVGNPKKDGIYLIRANNGYVCTLRYEFRDNYWHTMGYQSDVAAWRELDDE